MFYNLMILCLLVRFSAQVVVQTVQGKVEGVVEDGYSSFYGIPYASVIEPSGRFKDFLTPFRVSTLHASQTMLQITNRILHDFQQGGLPPYWSDIRPSTPVTSCPTPLTANCLTLDVHVPGGVPDLGWPVLVWLRGGGELHPWRIVQKGVILVIVTYRSGPLGFLCLGTEQVPGNTGVKDVVLALRWIRDNIVAFRGSPSHVVLAGQGFQAALVEALTLSPMAQGLFYGAIMQSGTALSPWAFNYDAQNRALDFLSLFTNSDDIHVAVSAILNTNYDTLKKNADKINYPYFPLGMCLEKPFKKEERLLSDEPIRILKNKMINKTPILIGFNSNEGYIFEGNLRKANVLNRMSKDFSILLPDELVFLAREETNRVVKQLRELYFDGNQTIDALLAFYSDAYFTHHVYRSALLHAQAQGFPVYLYQFAHSGDIGATGGVRKTGAAHGDELGYLFPEGGRKLEGDDGTVQDKVLDLWTNFVKFLNPTSNMAVQWPRLDPREPRLLHIATELDVRPVPRARAAHAWINLYDAYYYARQNVSGEDL